MAAHPQQYDDVHTSPPCASGCTRPNRHLPNCTTPCLCEATTCGHCTGCEPTHAEAGSQVCARCRHRTLAALDALPDLYEQLLDPSKPGGRQPGPRGNEKPLPIRVGSLTEDGEGQPGPHEERAAIGATLARLVLTLADDYGITPPRVALHGALLAAVDDRLHGKFAAIDAGDRIPPPVNTTPPPASPLDDSEWAAAVKARETAQAHATTLLRKVIAADQRITRLAATLDRTDPVHQHARHVAVHLTRLLARDDAGGTVHDLTSHARAARRLAAPGRPDGVTLGPCPTCGRPVRVTRGQADDVVTCTGCGTSGGVDWWHAAITGGEPAASTATTAQLAAWLSRRHSIPITETTVRKWGSRHPRLKTGSTDSKGRALYDVTAVMAYADSLPTPTGTEESA